MNPIQTIVDWYKLYPSVAVFLGHKVVHIVTGLVIAFFFTGIGASLAGQLFVFAVGVGKEFSDKSKSFDPTADVSKGEDPYRYDAPLSAHVLDVIVTQLGGVLGLLLGLWYRGVL